MNKPHVLYVDDESLNLSSFRMVLGEFFAISLANSASEALQILGEERIDVLVSDQRMPDMTGLELAQATKARGYDCVCIILTAFTDSEVAMRAINQGGIYRFILKPWDKDELQQAIFLAADRCGMERENAKLLSDLQKKTQEQEFFNKKLLAMSEELRVSNEDLKIAKQKAEENDELKTAFLQNMSHEIRTPLNGIIGFAELLTGAELEKEKFPEYANLIIESGQRLLNIVNDILDISKIETGQIEIEQTSFDLHAIFTELYLVYSNKLKGRDVTLTCHTDNDLPIFVKTDKTRLYQILSNFLNNACKYTKEGSIEFGYLLSGEATLDFYVRDTGIGIAKEEQGKIFERFFRSNNDLSKKSVGAGLGLSICDRLAHLLGGEITLSSTVGKGTTIMLRFPRSVVIGEELPNVTEKKVELQSVDGKILIAEDVDLNFFYLQELLRGISIVRARNGMEAVRAVQDDPEIRLVLMDLKMPQMDGFDATAKIKQLAPKLPIIAQTAYAMNHDIDKALACGVDDYIVKPIRKNELFDKVNKYANLERINALF